MISERRPGQLRTARYYIVNALKFYEMRNEKLTPVIFVILLFTGLAGNLISGTQMFVNNILYLRTLDILLTFIIAFFNAIYLHAFLTEVRGVGASFRISTIFVLRRFFKILLANLAFAFIVIAGAFLLIIPAFIFYLMFMFYLCFILDKDTSLKESFKKSRSTTHGKKMEILAINLLFNLTIFLPAFILLFITTGFANELILRFVMIFASTITTFMNQRLIALIYNDLTYMGESPKAKEDLP